MADSVTGGFPVTETHGDATGAPWLQTMVDDYALALNTLLGPAWGILSPTDSKPVCRTFTRDLEEGDFTVRDLPSLALWVDGNLPASGGRTDDELKLTHSLILQWVPPPIGAQRKSERSNMWVAASKAIHIATESKTWSIHSTSTAYGHTVKNRAGLESLNYLSGDPVALQMTKETVPAYRWRLSATEAFPSVPTFPAWPTVPAKMTADYYVGPDTDLLLLQQERPDPE